MNNKKKNPTNCHSFNSSVSHWAPDGFFLPLSWPNNLRGHCDTGMELWSETWTKFVGSGPVQGSLCVCVCVPVSGWMQDAERAHRAEVFPNLQTPTFLNHHEKATRNLAGEQGADCQERVQSSILSPQKTCNELEGLGGAEKQISCLCWSSLSAWLATVLQCVRIYIHMFVNPFFSTLRGFYLSDLNLCHMVSQTVQLQTAGGGRQRWQAGAGLRGTHRNSVLILGRSFSQNPLKGRNPLCIRLLCSGSWLVRIFIRSVGGNCGSLVADARPVLWHFSGPGISLYELSKDRNCE